MNASTASNTNGFPLLPADPEEVGIQPAALDRFTRRLVEARLNLHSLLVIRHGRPVTELYWEPYQPLTPHRLYSISKSFTSIAIGLCLDAGLCRLDDRVVEHFPDLVPDQVHPWISEMTLEHLLTMSTAHGTTTYKDERDTNLVRTFFTVAPTRPPGRLFAYDTSASVVLGALVERVTGRSLTGFINDRLWGPLGCEVALDSLRTPIGLPPDHAVRSRFSDGSPDSPSWREVEENPSGTDHAGSGFLCTPRDLARFALFCRHGGAVGDQQLLSADYVAAATGYQITTELRGGYDPAIDAGYGYQFWRTPHNGFACRGMGGQLALVHPDHDLVVVTTADNQPVGNLDGTVMTAVWQELLPCLESPTSTKSTPRTGQLPALLPAAAKAGAGDPPAKLGTKPYHFDSSNPMGISSLTLALEPDHGTLHLETDRGPLRYGFGLGQWHTIEFGEYGYPAEAIGYWVDGSRLRLTFRINGKFLGQVEMMLAFDRDDPFGERSTVTVEMSAVAEAFLARYRGVATSTSHS